MVGLSFDAALTALQVGEIELEGEFIHGSNYTFLVKVKPEGEVPLLAVYKPQEGERILWDFPDNTLAHREVAAYLVSQALGWDFIPPTVYRQDGPFGPGSVQLYIDHDPNYHYFNFSEDDFQRLRPVVIFDLLVNNADRKGSHIMFGSDGRLWLIDHGLCFNTEEKLRTVVWDFAGDPVPESLMADIQRFRQALNPSSPLIESLKQHLNAEEIEMLSHRADDVLAMQSLPYPPKDRRAYPYPPI
jgi:uncharacterized repeat protein (TIGR03843 family)